MGSFKSHNSGSFRSLTPVEENDDRGDIRATDQQYETRDSNKCKNQNKEDEEASDEYGLSLFQNPMQLS